MKGASPITITTRLEKCSGYSLGLSVLTLCGGPPRAAGLLLRDDEPRSSKS